MAGDHIIAWSLGVLAGGTTTLGNLQDLCGPCNGRKNNKTQEVALKYFKTELLTPGQSKLRDWQERALPVVMERILDEPVLVQACPGAGKTRFALEVAYRLLESNEISRVLIVVPTIGIKNGWRRSASGLDPGPPTIPLAPAQWRTIDEIEDRWAGAVFTYGALARMPETFMAHALDVVPRHKQLYRHRILVVLDEVHHAAADKDWGQKALTAFASWHDLQAKAILSLSGTPFRTDELPIAFVPHTGARESVLRIT